jgi:molecular chaperone GrpE
MPKTPKPAAKNNHEIKELQKKLDELTLALQRERADSMNLRRQHEEQNSSLRDMVKSSVIRELLPVIDNFERSLKHVPKDLADNEYIKGIQSVVRQFEKVLGDLGVQRIETVGSVFDPHLHEAVSMDEDGKGSHEIVSDELQSGYQIGDHVIRHAMVKVKMGELKK